MGTQRVDRYWSNRFGLEPHTLYEAGARIVRHGGHGRTILRTWQPLVVLETMREHGGSLHRRQSTVWLALRTQTFGDLDLSSPRIRNVHEPDTGCVRTAADGAVGLDACCLQFRHECVDVPDLKTHVIDRAALGRRLRHVDLAECDLRARNISRVELVAFAGCGPEVLDVPFLCCQRIRHLQVNVMHGHRSGYRLVFVDLNSDAIWSRNEPLPGISWLPLQACGFKPRNRAFEILDVEAEVVDDGSNRTAAVVLF